MRILQLCGSKRWMRQILENRKQRRRRGGARLHLLSWNVACVPAGPPTTKRWGTLKTSKRIQEFPARLGRDHSWSILCMQEFTSSNGELVTETTEGHQVFATPPCPGQRRLAIAVAAAFNKCIVNSSFRVRGRSCSVDVCWERKKFRVICTH